MIIKKTGRIAMDVIFERCCGIDVHKETLTACIMIGAGNRMRKEIRTFSTMTEDIEKLRQWLKGEEITHVAMESTGVYWKPVYNILEEDFSVMIANAKHIKHVPGRKTDVKDSEWICKLLRNGLIRGSFIPPRHIRQLRDLTRHRAKLNHLMTSEKNRLQKYLEDSNIKLASVASDIFGVSGRAMLKELLAGNENVEEIVDLAHGVLRNKKEALKKSCVGKLTEHHRVMIQLSLKHIEYMEGLISEIQQRIDKVVRENKLQKNIELLDTIPGVNETAAEVIVAEIGSDMGVFPTEHHLASWAGMSPGNNESAGKKKAATPPKETSG
jgi:transposase